MSVVTQAEEQFIAELTDVLRRAMAHARKVGAEEGVANLVRLATGQATDPRAQQETFIPMMMTPAPMAQTGSAPKIPKPRRYPYGFVSGNITKALLDNPAGLTKEALRDYCEEKLGAEMDQAAVDNTIKQFVKDKKATRTPEGRYQPAFALIES